jgi:hypothetical protein
MFSFFPKCVNTVQNKQPQTQTSSSPITRTQQSTNSTEQKTNKKLPKQRVVKVICGQEIKERCEYSSRAVNRFNLDLGRTKM